MLFLISIIVGVPTTTILISKFATNKQISLIEANRLIYSTNHLSLIFIYLVSDKYFFITFISLIIPSIVILQICANKNLNTNLNLNDNLKPFKLMDTFNNIVDTLPTILLKILIIMIFVSILSTMLKDYQYLTIILEITYGIDSLKLYHLPNFIYQLFIVMLLSFNGLSIILQVINSIKINNFSFKKFIYFKLFHLFLASMIFCLLYHFQNFFF